MVDTIKLYVYIIHSKALSNRDIAIKNLSTKLKTSKYTNISVEEIYVIASNDPSDIELTTIQQIIDYSVLNESHLQVFNQFIKNLHINQLSNTLKHVDALHKITEQPNDDLHLVLEDDMLFGDDVCKNLDDIISKYKKEPIVFLGLPTKSDSTDIDIQPTSNNFQLVPLVDSYIINYETAKLFKENFFPIKYSTMFQYNYIMKKLNIDSYQSNKNIFINGSKYGMFVSSLNPNNALVFNKDYVTVMEILNKDILSDDDKKIVEKLRTDSPINSSPDFLYLIAKYLTKESRFTEAEQVYKQSYDLLVVNNGIINHESALLKDYIRLFKNLQTF